MARRVGQHVGGDVYGPNIQIGSATGPVTVAWEQPDFRLELLTPQPRPRRIPRSQRVPSHLLDVHRLVVPYRPRPAAEAALDDWRDDDEPASVRLLYGPGGAGKSRLASRFATLSHEQGWAALAAADKSSPLREPTGRTDMPATCDVLVVVDYADRWPLKALTRLVETLTVRRGSDKRLRVLLLARPQTGFWEDVSAQLERVWMDLADPIGLDEFVTDSDDLETAFTGATAAFQRELEIAEREVPQPAGLRADPDISPLTVHMAALAAVCATDEGVQVPESSNLSAYLLKHERRYWQSTPVGSDVMAKAVLVATLFGPITSLDRAREWLRRARLADGDAAADHLLTLYERLYPAGPAEGVSALPPLKPGRFAEDFLAGQLHDKHNQELVTELITDERTQVGEARQALLMLASAGSQRPVAHMVLFNVLSRPRVPAGWLSPPVVTTVLRHAPYEVAAIVEAAIPFQRIDLLRLARDLALRLQREGPPDPGPPERARLLIRLGNRLGDTGDNRAALGPTWEATKIYLQLVDKEPAAYLPELAASFNNVGYRLSGLGDKQTALKAAQEAVEIYRLLARSQPAAYLPDLALSLNNLCVDLLDIGNQKAAFDIARESVEIRRKLAEADPDTYLPGLALSLNNLARCLGEVGNEQAALDVIREVISIYRELTRTEPTAHLPHLSMALYNLGISLSEMGDNQAALDAALEAVEIRRRLVEAEPAAYLADLADSLITLGMVRFRIRSLRAGLESTEEALTIHRALAKALPAVHLPQVTKCLSNLGLYMWALGDEEAALAYTREALDIRRHLVDEESSAFLPDLARTLTGFGIVRHTHGKELRSALQAADEAVEIYSKLTEQLPAAYDRYLREARRVRAELVEQLGDQTEPSPE